MKAAKYFFYLTLSLTYLLLTSAIHAEELQSRSRENIQRGLIAAKQPDWPLAIRYFKKALKFSPQDPSILFNLALAYDNAGNQELISLPYYCAYLAAAKQAANHEQIRQRILEIEINLESKILKILKWDHDIIEKEIDTEYRHIGTSVAYGKNALAQYRIGDLSGAFETIKKVSNSYWRSGDYLKIIEAQIADGDLEDAQSTCSRFEKNDDYKVYAYLKLAEAYHQTGDQKNSP